jgi:hypothetical protein
MHGKFPAIQQNQQNSILFHETTPFNPLIPRKLFFAFFVGTCIKTLFLLGETNKSEKFEVDIFTSVKIFAFEYLQCF